MNMALCLYVQYAIASAICTPSTVAEFTNVGS